MSFIKIVRLKTGEDLISFIEDKKDIIKLIHPLMFVVYYNTKEMSQELILNFYLPISIIEETSVEIPKIDIAFTLTPKKSFKEYYLNFLNAFDDLGSNDTKINKSTVENLLAVSDNSKINKLH
jgi:hypothetical protein